MEDKTEAKIDQDIQELKIMLTRLVESEDKLSSDLIELRNHVFATHEYIHDNLQLLLTKAIYHVKRPKNFRRYAWNYIWITPVLSRLGLKETTEVCVDMGLMGQKDKDRIMKVNTHRNNFGHRNGKKIKIQEYESKATYLSTMKDLVIAYMTAMDVAVNYSKHRRSRRIKSLSDLARYADTIVEQNKKNIEPA